MQSSATVVELRQSLQARLADARARTDELFHLVRPEALRDRPIPERHRIIFYLGHLEAFDWNLIPRSTFDQEAFDQEFDKLFAFGIDPVDGKLPTDKESDWPGEEKIYRYNARVREAVDDCLRRGDLSGSTHAYLKDGLVFHVAIEHRLMHTETLAYMLHRLSPERKVAQPTGPAPTPEPVEPRVVEIPAGRTTLGLTPSEEFPFGWDNEFQPQTVEVSAFAIDVYPVTNGQYLRFMEAGGYKEKKYWSEDAWDWRVGEAIEHPAFWSRRDGEWFYGTMFSETLLPLDWPVYVSHAEASAFARWQGKHLPTEAQWHRAAYGTPGGGERPYPWGEAPPESRHGNFDFQRWTATPVNAHPAGASAFGVLDLLGNGWEWTSTVFGPFPGFERFPFYPGYSANFFDGKHYVMKGGSVRTAACMLRPSFRNWFQTHYPYIYSTFRCVRG